MRDRKAQRTRAEIVRQHWQSPALPFTDSVHLAANFQGQLTPEQIQVLIKEKASQTREKGYLFLIFPFLLILLMLLLMLDQEFAHFASPFLFPFLLPLALLMGLGGVFVGLGFARRKRFREDIALGKIVLSVIRREGEIVWDQKRKAYWANLSDSLSFPLYNRLPGPYLFYFVEEEGKIVSLMPLHTPMQREQALQTVQMALCQTLRFSLSDLETNRNGLLSEKQRRQIRWFHKRPLTVRSLEGEILGVSTGGYYNTPPSYYYDIEGNSIRVPNANTLSALVHRVRYRVYYLARPLPVLSVEPLEVLE